MPVGTAGAGSQSCQGSRSSGGSGSSGGSVSEVKAEPRDSSVGHTHLPKTAASGRGLSLLGSQLWTQGWSEAGQCLLAARALETHLRAAVWCTGEAALDLW